MGTRWDYYGNIFRIEKYKYWDYDGTVLGISLDYGGNDKNVLQTGKWLGLWWEWDCSEKKFSKYFLYCLKK